MIPMKRIVFICLGAGLLTGCAQRYDMTLTNGVHLTNVSKPAFDHDNGVYSYKDVTGAQRYINAGRVVEIKPHSNKADLGFNNR
jgi:hypothetical protein